MHYTGSLLPCHLCDPELAIWRASIFAVLMVCLPLILAGQRQPDSGLPVRLYTFLVALSGFLWGSLVLLWSADLALSDQRIISILPMALTMGVIVICGSWPLTYRAFVVGLQIPVLIILFLSADSRLACLVAPLLEVPLLALQKVEEGGIFLRMKHSIQRYFQ